jgi:hypothetical protein
MKIFDLKHPDYVANAEDWSKWRLTYESGTAFITKYLKTFSFQENPLDFQSRAEITYIPAFAKSAINEIKNSIFQRSCDIKREGGSTQYKQAIAGNLGGVDLRSSSIVKLLNDIVIELLVMGRVGIFVDMYDIQAETRADITDYIHPYCYIVKSEDIFSYCYENGELVSLLLRVYTYVKDEETGLIKDTVPEYKLFNNLGVITYNEKGEEVKRQELKIPKIPFIIAEITDSLLKDVSNYQIALLNLASSDMNFALKANFPFYTEQFDPRVEIAAKLRKSEDGEKSTDSGTNKVAIGTLNGRRYAKDLERPEFIAPPAHTLQVSIDKQNQMKEEIRQLVHLALASLRPKMVSAEAISMESEGLESGLAYLGLILESTEKQIAYYWHLYGNTSEVVTVSYPKRYALKSDSERLQEADARFKVIGKIPSKLFKKESIKDIASMLLGSKVNAEILDTILAEIDSAEITNTDPEVLLRSVENALLSNETASRMLGYPEGETAKAAIDHSERIARIVKAQTADDSSSRGDKISSTNIQSSKQEKVREI